MCLALYETFFQRTSYDLYFISTEIGIFRVSVLFIQWVKYFAVRKSKLTVNAKRNVLIGGMNINCNIPSVQENKH